TGVQTCALPISKRRLQRLPGCLPSALEVADHVAFHSTPPTSMTRLTIMQARAIPHTAHPRSSSSITWIRNQARPSSANPITSSSVTGPPFLRDGSALRPPVAPPAPHAASPAPYAGAATPRRPPHPAPERHGFRCRLLRPPGAIRP